MFSTWKIGLVALLAVVAVKHADAVCNSCNSNGVACISNTSFHLCHGGIPQVDQTFDCPNANQVCTLYGGICMNLGSSPNVRPACGDTTTCGQCRTAQDGDYTCTSRTTYTMCFGNALSNIRGKCPDGQLCFPSLALEGKGLPCGSECAETGEEIVCDLDTPIDEPAPITTTTVFAPTPDTTTTAIPTTAVPTTASPTTVSPTTPVPTTVSPTTVSPTTVSPTTVSPTTASTTTAAPATTTQIPITSTCMTQNQSGRFANPNDATCRSYIYCLYQGGVLVGRQLSCPPNKYFNAVIHNCQDQRPAGCIG